MKVREIMKRLIHTVRAEATLEQAACSMRDEDVGFLPVVEEADLVETQVSREIIENIGFRPLVEKETLVGTLTDRDIVVRAVASGKDSGNTMVSEIMTKHFAVCHEDDELSEAASVMEQKMVRRLFVLNHEGQTVGIVSLDDISATEPCLSGEVLQTITK